MLGERRKAVVLVIEREKCVVSVLLCIYIRARFALLFNASFPGKKRKKREKK